MKKIQILALMTIILGAHGIQAIDYDRALDNYKAAEKNLARAEKELESKNNAMGKSFDKQSDLQKKYAKLNHEAKLQGKGKDLWAQLEKANQDIENAFSSVKNAQHAVASAENVFSQASKDLKEANDARKKKPAPKK